MYDLFIFDDLGVLKNPKIITIKLHPMEATAVNLTPEAISKLLTGDIDKMHPAKPVVQVIDIKRRGECRIVLSDGSKFVRVYISGRVMKLVSSKQLEKGSIVQLTKFSAGLTSGIWGRPITVKALNVICSKCDIIGVPKPFYDPPIYSSTEDDSDEVDSDEDDSDELSQNEDVLAPTQKCSCSQTQSNKKRKIQSSDHKILEIAKDISRIAKMMMEKNKENDMGACFEKLEKIGWGTEDSMYNTAVLLFSESADYRKVWLHLKPESCEKWVKNAGSKFRLLG